MALVFVAVVSGCVNRKEICCPLDFRATDTRAYPHADSRFYATNYAYAKDAAYINSTRALKVNGTVVPYLGPEATVAQQP